MKELESMEQNIHQTEDLLSKLTEESLLPKNSTNSVRMVEITREMTRLQSEIDRLYARWAELEPLS
jgi:ATP-binding cassette subfamily F protein uup